VAGEQELERALKVLGPLEGRIMRAVWSGSVQPPFTVRDIQRVTPELAYTTLMTTLSRLAEKGVVTQTRVPQQRAFEYRAAGSPSEFLAAASREQANRMLEQFGDAALVAFAAQLDELPREQRERLRMAAGRE
jgi:predicted transcriptional regulator